MAEGYDTNRFQSTINEGFTCPICLGVLKDPMQCENNEHYFCSSCIKEHLKKTSQSCPVCNDKLTVDTLRKAPRIVADCVSRLKISCDHAAKGCNAVLELGTLQRHLQECDFQPVTCSNEGCRQVVCKRDVKHHELELCRFKTATCDDCGEKMPYHKYGAHGCVLRRDFDEMKKGLAEMKSTQHEMMNELRQGMQRMTIAMENLQKARSSDILVIGGFDPDAEKVVSSVKRFNLFNQTWIPMPALNEARCGFATVLFENQILVCGGSTDNNFNDAIDSIEVLEVNDDPTEWRGFLVNLPIKVVGHKCVVYGNRMLIIGGTNERDEILDTIYELLLVPPYSSKLLCHMNKKRIGHAAELFNDKVLIAGGCTEPDNGSGAKSDDGGGAESDVGSGAESGVGCGAESDDGSGAESDDGSGAESGVDNIDSVEIFDITSSKCIEMPPLPSPLSFMASVRRGDSMLLIGGTDNEDNGHNEILEYDSKTGESKVQLVMPTELSSCAAVYHGNTLVVVGGVKENPAVVDCYNYLSGSWSKLPSMDVGRSLASAIIVNKEKFEF